MKRKIFQITIFSLFILISFLFFKIYLEKNKVTNNIRKLNEKNIFKETNEITEINYTTEDIRGNTYNIKAQYEELYSQHEQRTKWAIELQDLLEKSQQELSDLSNKQ